MTAGETIADEIPNQVDEVARRAIARRIDAALADNARLRAEVELLTRARDETVKKYDLAKEWAAQHQNAAERLHALGTQLVGALRECEPRRHTDFCAAENHPGLPCSCAYAEARAALAVAKQAGIT